MDRKDYLRAKIAAPQVPHKLLPRNNVAAIVNNTLLEAAVCFIAPYGYGKTLSVISWLRDSGKDTVWISLDSSDDSEQVLFAELSAAMLRATGWQGDVNNILSDPEYIEDSQGFLWKTIAAVEKSGCNKIFVIDNFQHIRNRGLQRSIRDIISALLGRWRVIIMSRVELPQVFVELIMRGQICMITPKKLSFTMEETADFFEMGGCVASDEDVSNVRIETEGWPASLNVVSMLSRGGDIAYGEAARGYMKGFFETEIWGGLEENIRGFLIRTSVLDKLTPAGCRAVTETSETLSILHWLFTNGLFISKLEEKDAYRYHRVFQDFLLDKLAASGVDEQKLYRKLGWWLFDNNEITNSFPCFFKAGDLYGVNQVLRMVNPVNMGGIDRYLEMAGCITELDILSLNQYPLIVSKITLIHFLTGDIARMRSLYQLFCEWSDPGVLSVSHEEYAEFMWEIGWLNYLDPDVPTLDDRNRRWVNDQIYLPEYLKKLHKDREAVLCFPTMLRGVRDCCDGLFELENFVNRIEAGEKNLVDETISLWLTYVMLAEYHYERERFSEAESIIRRIMSQVEDRQLTYIYFICTALLVKIVRAAHDPREVDDLVRRLGTMIASSGHTFLLPNFHAFELRNLLVSGHTGFTEVFENENRDYAETPYFYLIYRHFTFVRGLLSLENYTRAMLILGNLELLCQRYNRPIDLIEINILKSIALYNLGYEEDACQHLINAIKPSEQYGFIRMFSDSAGYIWPILELVRKQIPGKYIRQIIISCKKTLARSGHKPPMSKFPHLELTKTELKILRAVQSGMSYAEIAQDNGVRMSTVKSHLHSIYSKLEARNKTEAVIAAQSMGILE